MEIESFLVLPWIPVFIFWTWNYIDKITNKTRLIFHRNTSYNASYWGYRTWEFKSYSINPPLNAKRNWQIIYCLQSNSFILTIMARTTVSFPRKSCDSQNNSILFYDYRHSFSVGGSIQALHSLANGTFQTLQNHSSLSKTDIAIKFQKKKQITNTKPKH